MSRHLVIAGTGRAGTSFLVRWLGEAGLDVGNFGPGHWHPEARAGYERNLLGHNLPYVVKDPWLYNYCELVNPDMIDVLVIPMRKLEDVAQSRIENELAAWPYPGGDVGHAKGGIVASTDPWPVQATLAIGFHRLVWWAVSNRVAHWFMEYPRLVDDDVYAAGEMEQVLAMSAVSLDADLAVRHVDLRAAHRRVAGDIG